MKYYNKYFENHDCDKIWVFRGMRNCGWSLKTTLEREIQKAGIAVDKTPDYEKSLLRKFKRHFHHFDSYHPAESETVEWFAMMQHYGAPTRLLDWTYSFFVALYFAIEDSEINNKVSVWVIDAKWCANAAMNSINKIGRSIPKAQGKYHYSWEIKSLHEKNGSIKFGQDGTAFDFVFGPSGSMYGEFVYPMNPFFLNQRLTSQLGLFLCPRNITTSFERNLEAMPEADQVKCLDVELINKDLRDQILRNLYHMNITRASLFPGLDGFAKSLGPLLAVPEALPPGMEENP